MLDRALKFLPTVGEKRAELLNKELGLKSFSDLMMHLPIRYLDRSRIYTIAEVAHHEMPYVQIRARVHNIQFIGTGFKGRLVVQVSDSTGVADLVWFRSLAWVQKRLELHREFIFFGKPTLFNGVVNMVHPEFELPNAEGRGATPGVQGVYSTTEKLTASMLGSRALAGLVRTMWGIVQGQIQETLPQYLIRQLSLMGREEALYTAHFPASPERLERAIFRLKFEELFSLQLAMLIQKRIRIDRSIGFRMATVGEKFNRFYAEVLPFPLTNAQKRVVREIRTDMNTGHQMNRLLQGDVGSGKTIVALLAMLIAADNGFQSIIMAPTEILARQHYDSISELCRELGARVEIWTGSTRKKERAWILEGLLSGEVHILIGTHALIEEGVQLSNLGLVIIDEQHRFGVKQRARLWTKNHTPPHILVMTATPIPRTLAMTLYGDLDVSVIDELPPGRKPIVTMHFFEDQRLRVAGIIRHEIDLGRQVYVVYPMIKESAKIDIANLEQGVIALEEHFPVESYPNIVVHGQMKQAMKDYGMAQFKDGAARILVSTTVIEVGVNVPNATVMLIENAERFGLSQLHQLRGRVGRGGDQSYCILMTSTKLSTESRKRIEAMVSTTDGFELAQLDLEIRGAGDIEGTRQSGQAIELLVADLARDGDIVEKARGVAEQLLASDPYLQRPENRVLHALIQKQKTQEPIDLSMIS